MKFLSPLALLVYIMHFRVTRFNCSGPKAFIAAMHKGFSDLTWTVQKSIPEDDGGEDIIAGRSEWTGTFP